MSDWKAKLEAMMAQSEQIAWKAASATRASAPPLPAIVPMPEPERDADLPPQVRPMDDETVSERAEIRRRVETFRTHQLRFTRERGDFAAATIAQMKQLNPKVR